MACGSCFMILAPGDPAPAEAQRSLIARATAVLRRPSCASCGGRMVAIGSKAEAYRLAELRLLLTAGKIEGLRLQPRFPLVINHRRIGTYRADFAYKRERSLVEVVEDVKGADGWMTPIAKMKIAVFEALYDKEVAIIRR